MNNGQHEHNLVKYIAFYVGSLMTSRISCSVSIICMLCLAPFGEINFVFSKSSLLNYHLFSNLDSKFSMTEALLYNFKKCICFAENWF